MQPTREQAHTLLKDAGRLNPGPWVEHSRAVARCAQRIAARCGLDAEKAYILGLLHDIGRRYGVTNLKHAIDGYRYLTGLGYHEAARVCLTHSFSTKKLDDHIGKIDVTADELDEIMRFIQQTAYDDYDRLIQLCDTMAGVKVVGIHARIADIERRYNGYPNAKRDAVLTLKTYFEEKCGDNIYKVATDEEALWGL